MNGTELSGSAPSLENIDVFEQESDNAIRSLFNRDEYLLYADFRVKLPEYNLISLFQNELACNSKQMSEGHASAVRRISEADHSGVAFDRSVQSAEEKRDVIRGICTAVITEACFQELKETLSPEQADVLSALRDRQKAQEAVYEMDARIAANGPVGDASDGEVLVHRRVSR